MVPTQRPRLILGRPKRLIRGPAYGKSIPEKAGLADWPGYRGDAKRSGSNRLAQTVSRDLQEKWDNRAGRQTHRSRSLPPEESSSRISTGIRSTRFAAETGEPLWKFIAGGRVDSTPTYYEGTLLFGANDGNVYCLDASNGDLIWRFTAAPNSRRITAFGQVESPWPVHGTVLVMNGLAYVAAGRSTLD